MRFFGLASLSALVPLLVLSLACVPRTDPSDGSIVGRFTIQATLTSNTCAPGYNPASPTTFGAALYASGGTSTWVTSGSSVTGTASGNTIHVVAHSASSPFTNCVLDQTETIDASYVTTPSDGGSPDAGAHTATISGTDTVTISTSSGPPCDALLLFNGGVYPMLPCSATFAFTGTTN